MKTIAVTIDETTLQLLDNLLVASPQRRSRSALVQTAIREWQREVEACEGEIFHKHKKRLARQAQALVAEQTQLHGKFAGESFLADLEAEHRKELFHEDRS